MSQILIACPGEPPVRGKHLGDISYTRRVKVDFVLNFVAMATGVGRNRICLASFNSQTPKTHWYTQSCRGYLLYRPRVIADFVSKFVAMQRGLVAVEFVWRHSIARPRKPSVIRKDLGDISFIGRVVADFVPNFVAMQRGLVAVEFVWRHSIARPRKPAVIRKDLRDICYTSRVIADLVPNFVCHGNRGWSH